MEYNSHTLLLALQESMFIYDGHDFLAVHSWLKTMDDVLEYMHSIPIPNPLISRYIYSTWLIHRVNGALIYTEEKQAPLSVYKLFSGVFSNLSVQQIAPILNDCMRYMNCAIHINPTQILMGRAARTWCLIHKCSKITIGCDCRWTVPEMVRCMEDVLMLHHNAKISEFSNVWDENYHSYECMTTWIPKEIMEDVVELCKSKSADTRLVRV